MHSVSVQNTLKYYFQQLECQLTYFHQCLPIAVPALQLKQTKPK